MIYIITKWTFLYRTAVVYKIHLRLIADFFVVLEKGVVILYPSTCGVHPPVFCRVCSSLFVLLTMPYSSENPTIEIQGFFPELFGRNMFCETAWSIWLSLTHLVVDKFWSSITVIAFIWGQHQVFNPQRMFFQTPSGWQLSMFTSYDGNTCILVVYEILKKY